MKLLHRFFFIFFMFVFSQINLQAMDDVTLKSMGYQDAIAAKKLILQEYAQDLVKSGCCENREKAIEEAYKECNMYEIKNHENFLCIVSSDDKNLIGYIWYDHRDNPNSVFSEYEAYIQSLYICENMCGKGFCEKVMKSFENYLKNQNFYFINFDTFDHNQTAVNLYKKLGYEIKKNYKIEEKTVVYHMQKKL